MLNNQLIILNWGIVIKKYMLLSIGMIMCILISACGASAKADWKEVENYLKEYVGDFYEIAYCSEKIFIDTDFPDEYSNSDSRIALKRSNIFGAVMLVRHDEDGKKYLYDFTTIKKETSSPLES